MMLAWSATEYPGNLFAWAAGSLAVALLAWNKITDWMDERPMPEPIPPLSPPAQVLSQLHALPPFADAFNRMQIAQASRSVATAAHDAAQTEAQKRLTEKMAALNDYADRKRQLIEAVHALFPD